ncbi:MAG: hypothetical protein C0595_06460 [Marinilabiliales bacterium]|nr:MAG: hypothetical protein C0595_06460 [Marinilabiliales bacterium]
MKAFYSSLHHSQRKNMWEYIPVSPVCDELPKILKRQLDEMVKFSQTNLDNCKEGRVGVLFSSIYPVERGWFDENNITNILLGTELFTKSAICSSGFNEMLVNSLVNDITNNKKVNYFQDLSTEYYYLNSNQAKSEDNNKTFFMANSFDEIEAVELNNDNTNIALIFNIEGGHSLIDFTTYKVARNTPFRKVNKRKYSEYKRYKEQIFRNIDILKGEGEKEIYIDGNAVNMHFNHTPLFITFAHHFWNLLCGHADSLNLGGDILLNQNRAKGRKFSRLGREVLHKLLERDDNKRRILIDIKHLSIRAREEFFKIWKNDYYSKGDSFPIISSHAAVNGRQSYGLRKRIEMENNYFNDADINMFDKDIRIVFKSDGIIGLILNEVRLPGFQSSIKLKKNKRKIRKLLKKDPDDSRIEELKSENKQIYLQCLVTNMFHIVRTINEKRAWDIISIGSDFDGMIDTLDNYYSATNFINLKNDLNTFIDNCNNLLHISIDNEEFKYLKFGYTTNEILDKIFHTNAIEFLRKYFHDDFLKKGIKHKYMDINKLDELDPEDYGLSKRQRIVKISDEEIGLVKMRKSRIIMKDGEQISKLVNTIKSKDNKLKVKLIISGPICSKTVKYLKGNNIDIVSVS